MRLTKLRLQNFKSWPTLDLDFAPLTYIHGQNFKGKTAIIQGICLALCGRLPGRSTKPGDLYDRLASGNPMGVQAEFDDEYIKRIYTKGKTCKVQTEARVMSADWALPTTLFSPLEFLELSANDRVKHLFATLGTAEPITLTSLVAKLKSIKCDPHTEAHEKAVNVYRNHLEQEYGHAVSSTPPSPSELQLWLERGADTVRETTNNAVASAKRMRSTAIGVTELKAPDAQSLSRAEQARTQARQALDEINAQVSKLTEEYNQARREYPETKRVADSITCQNVNSHIEELNTLQSVAPVEPIIDTRTVAQTKHNNLSKEYNRRIESLRDLKRNLADLEKQLTTVKAKVINWPVPFEHNIPFTELREDVNRLTRALEDLTDSNELIADADAAMREAAAVVTRLDTQCNVLQETRSLIIGQIAALDNAACCPSCKSHHAGWKVESLNEKHAELEAVKKEIGLKTALLVTSQDTLKDCKLEHGRFTQRIQASALTAAQLNTAKAVLKKRTDDEQWYRSASETANRETEEKLKQETALTEQIRTAENLVSGTESELRVYELETLHPAYEVLLTANRIHNEYTEALKQEQERQKRINSLKTTLAASARALEAAVKLPELEKQGLKLKADVSTATLQATAAQQKYDETDLIHRKAVQDAASAVQIAKAATVASEAEAEAEIGKELQKILTTTLSECVDGSIKPLIESCNQLCGPILTAPIVYENGEIGMRRSTGFVPWQEFSGTETALAMAALGIGLAHKSELKLAVIDECGRIHHDKKLVMLEHLFKLIDDKVIDQAICIDVSPPPVTSRGSDLLAIQL